MGEKTKIYIFLIHGDTSWYYFRLLYNFQIVSPISIHMNETKRNRNEQNNDELHEIILNTMKNRVEQLEIGACWKEAKTNSADGGEEIHFVVCNSMI